MGNDVFAIVANGVHNIEIRMERPESRLARMEHRLDWIEMRLDCIETKLYRHETRPEAFEVSSTHVRGKDRL